MKQIEVMCRLIGCNIIQRYRFTEIIQNNQFYNLQKSQVHPSQGKIDILLYYSSRKLETRQLNVTCYPELDPFVFLGSLSNLNRASVLVNNNGSIFWL